MKLTSFCDGDLPILQKWMADKSLMYYIVTEKSESSMPYVSLAIRSGPALIGWANLFNIDDENRKAEYGIAIPDQKCTRLGGLVTIQILKYAFYNIKPYPDLPDLNLHRVYVRPLASNVLPGWQDTRERFGFVRESREREAVKRGDIYEDVIVMSILKDEFRKRWD
jgi:RimJ/RimL family protein N-acetyltransferase